MSFDEILLFAIALNVTSGAWRNRIRVRIDDRVGAKPTILAALTALTCVMAILWWIQAVFICAWRWRH
ncbi:MAG: hypothetical protein R3D05_11970 [Dongiaceae bacterium]